VPTGRLRSRGKLLTKLWVSLPSCCANRSAKIKGGRAHFWERAPALGFHTVRGSHVPKTDTPSLDLSLQRSGEDAVCGASTKNLFAKVLVSNADGDMG